MSNSFYKSLYDFTWYRSLEKQAFQDLYSGYFKDVKVPLSELKFKKEINSFLEFCKKELIENPEGIVLPESLGELRVIGVIPKFPVVSTSIQKADGNHAYLTNDHTDGYLYKVFYFWKAPGDKVHAYRSAGLWRFVPSAKVKKSIFNRIKGAIFLPWNKVNSLKEVNPTTLSVKRK